LGPDACSALVEASATGWLEVGGADAAADGAGAAGGGMVRFCIFCMSERFRASNLLRKMDEYVLNLRHYVMLVSVKPEGNRNTHSNIIGDLEDQLSLGCLPFHAVPRLPAIRIVVRDRVGYTPL